jgi:hypothetical protein
MERRKVKNLSAFTVKNQIPLNPPFPTGDFRTPLCKGGQGGFSFSGVKHLWFMDV